MKRTFLPILILTAILAIIVLLNACTISRSATPAETPAPTPTVDRLAAPPEPEDPTQAELGAHVYHQVCMACHGDFGQGLTDEWRAVWQEDANCWQPECHGPDHPDHGFQIYDTCCPPVLGPNTLTRFDNAQELFTYNSELMPWWNPGYLRREEYWQVTAFLMREKGAIPNDVTLDEGNAFAFKLHPASPLPGDRRADVWVVSALLITVAGLIYFQKKPDR
jgi:cytochrome c5